MKKHNSEKETNHETEHREHHEHKEYQEHKEHIEHSEKQHKEHKEMVPKSEYDELNDHYKRILAEFDNFKKRSRKEKDSLYNSVLSDVIEVILPVLDNLENAAKAETKDEEYKKGIELVLKQFKDVLKSKGLEEIPTVGEIFDPNYHEAVSSVQDESKQEKEIVQEYRKGYKLGNKVVRHAMVVVAN